MKAQNKYYKLSSYVYFFCLMFITPILISILDKKTHLRSFQYIWVAVFLIFIIYKKQFHVLLSDCFRDDDFVVTDLNNSNKGLITFFSIVLLSFIYSTVTDYYSFNMSPTDFSTFDTMIQEAIRGKIGYATFNGFYHAVVHQNYILFAFVPLYKLFNSPLFLQICAALSLWMSGIILWFICREYFSKFRTFLIILAYFSSSHLFLETNFRPEIFYPLAIMLLYLTYLKKSNWGLIASCVFLLSIKEEAVLYIISFSIFMIYDYHKNIKSQTPHKIILKRTIILVILIACVVAYINFAIVQPYYLAKNHMVKVPTLNFWSIWGNNKKTILLHMLLHPFKVLEYIFNTTSGFWSFYAPTLFIIFIDSFALIMSIPLLALFLSSNYGLIHTLWGYYPIGLFAIMYIALIRITVNYKNNKLLQLLLLIIILTISLWGKGYQQFYHINYKTLDSFRAVKSYIKNNYKNLNICPVGDLYPHFNLEDFPNLQPQIKMDENARPDFIGVKDCIVTFSTIGDNYPFTRYLPSIIEQTKLNTRCKQFGQFFVCNNYDKGSKN